MINFGNPSTEPEIIVEPVQTFDYRHKPVNRIPLPQRPKWLTEVFKNIHQFDPLTTRLELRRYSDRRYDDRRQYDDYYEDRKPGLTRGGYYEKPPYTEGPSFPEKRKYDDRRGYENTKDRENEAHRNEPSYDDRDNEFDNRQQRYCERSPPKRFESSDRYRDEHYSSNKSGRDSPIFIKADDTKTKPETLTLTPSSGNSKVTLIEDLLCPPGRFNRPSRIVIILRGPPGSGKTFLAKMIKDKEVSTTF